MGLWVLLLNFPSPAYRCLQFTATRPVCVLRARNVSSPCYFYVQCPKQKIPEQWKPPEYIISVYYINCKNCINLFDWKKNMARIWKKQYSLSIYLERHDIRGKEIGEGSTLLQATGSEALMSMTPLTTNTKDTLKYNHIINGKVLVGTERGFYILLWESQKICKSTKSIYL